MRRFSRKLAFYVLTMDGGVFEYRDELLRSTGPEQKLLRSAVVCLLGGIVEVVIVVGIVFGGRGGVSAVAVAAAGEYADECGGVFLAPEAGYPYGKGVGYRHRGGESVAVPAEAVADYEVGFIL